MLLHLSYLGRTNPEARRRAQFLGLSEASNTMARLPVFYKQRNSLLFPGYLYAIPPAVRTHERADLC